MAASIHLKQFPGLMSQKTVLYVHGFASSGQSGTVALLRQLMPAANVIAPDLPVRPAEAMALLHEICDAEHPSLIMGTSMGGMYTEQLAGYDRICVNPALEMADTMKAHGMIGTQHFQNPRKDGIQEFIVTKALVKEYREQTEKRFMHVDEAERQRVYGLFGDEDTTVDCRALFQGYYPNAIPFHGEHRLNDSSLLHSVIPVIRWIDDEQEHRQRPVVYIGTETMADGYGKPASSVQKAVRQLVENYQVFFVAPAKSSVQEEYAQTTEWLTEYVGVPAWGHTIFTNRRDLLYGDYFVSSQGDTETMATLLHYGSSKFKTWEEIIEYFQLLGGQ